MNITLDRDAVRPLYQQIAGQIKKQILTGQLAAGYQLPPERRLADSLDVNRTTVLNAYRELKAEGLIESHVGQGTVVAAPVSISVSDYDESPKHEPPIWNHYFSEFSNRFDNMAVNDLLTIANKKDMISFAAGIASPESGPKAVLEKITKDIFRQDDYSAFLHSPVQGFFQLRKSIAAYMETRGCFCSPEQIMILSGSQQGIDLTARLLLNPGDTVIVEEPTFFPVLQVFKALGARIMTVPTDRDGMQTDLLEQLLIRCRPKLIYTIPTFHNPCGTELCLERRKHLVSLAGRYKVPVLEDDAYGGLCYEGASLPTLKSMDADGYIIYLSTFSKIVYPGLRIGWLAADRPLLQRLSAARQATDLHTSCISQKMIQGFLDNGSCQKHIAALCMKYRKRRDLMLAAIEKYAPQGFTYNVPRGGYYIWCRLPEGISAKKLLEAAAGYNVAFVPGDIFYPGDAPAQYIRLNYTYPPEALIEEGVKRLMQALQEIQTNLSAVSPDNSADLNPII